jgi:hypothetical protein
MMAFWRQAARGARLAAVDGLLLLLLAAVAPPGWVSSVSPTRPLAVPYARSITAAARAHDLDPRLLAAVVETESGFDPAAVSAAGAMGLGQLMPATARACGVSDPFHPGQNLDCAAWLLADLLATFPLPLALAAYNAGEPAVFACNCIPANGETDVYVPRVLAAYGRFQRHTAVSPRETTRSPLLSSPELLLNRLYGGGPYRLTDPTRHGLPGWEGIDASAGCGAVLYAPLSGVITYNGPDGYVGPHGGPSSLLTITAGDGAAVSLLHGQYTVPPGTAVTAGETVIGREAAVGNASGCHTHLVPPGP